MAKKPPAILVYADNYHLVAPLADESAGKLFKALLEYAYNGSETAVKGDSSIKGIFNLMKAQIDRNNKHYADVARKRSEAGKKGGAPKGNQNAKKSSVYSKETASFDLDDYSGKSLFDD